MPLPDQRYPQPMVQPIAKQIVSDRLAELGATVAQARESFLRHGVLSAEAAEAMHRIEAELHTLSIEERDRDVDF